MSSGDYKLLVNWGMCQHMNTKCAECQGGTIKRSGRTKTKVILSLGCVQASGVVLHRDTS